MRWLLAVLACRPAPADPTPGSDSDTATPVEAPSLCATEGFGREVPFDAEGPYGQRRHDRAADFTLPLAGGETFTLSERWTGCESYVFVPDSVPAGADGSGSVWETSLDALVERSPENVHYFFVSTASDAPTARAARDAMVARRDEVVRALGKRREAWWGERLHVVADRADKLDSWVGELLRHPVGASGFAIDRDQRIRGLGSLADVRRYDGAVGWWDNDLAYAAHEVAMYNAEAERQDRLDAVEATVVPVFTGEVLSQYAEADVVLPSAAEMAGFDTFEIDVDMRCPDPELAELGNCGAWDYLAHFSVQEPDGSWTELARFITTYHREARWVADATPLLAHLRDGGARRVRWEWAPYWNVQPTETRLSLRFSNLGKGVAPVAATRVATGGPFGSTYDEGRGPVDVPIPADAAKVELVVIVTGHGAGTNSCAEFCDHQHEWTVGDTTWLVEFPEAGTTSGCEDAGIPDQMTPNQYGTWWFGRGGWCPGAPVLPRVLDVTGDVRDGTLTVGYRGLYGGGTPPDGSGDILLNAWVVTYR